MISDNNKKITNISIGIFALVTFIVITFPNMINHLPTQDESQNYMVSYFMNFGNFIDVLKSHGHPVLWYLIMMPFSKTDFCYPYSIFIINYIFILSALIIMWIKAPFNNYIKLLITFSYMMVTYFAVYARCYAIGILGFFILAALYKNQIKKPVLYATILGITANTSAVATAGTLGLLFPFLFNLFKNRNLKQIILSMLILIFSFSFMLYPHITNLQSSHDCNIYGLTVYIIKEFFVSKEFAIAFFITVMFILFNRSDEKNKIEFNQAKLFLFISFTFFIILMLFY